MHKDIRIRAKHRSHERLTRALRFSNPVFWIEPVRAVILPIGSRTWRLETSAIQGVCRESEGTRTELSHASSKKSDNVLPYWK